MENGETRCSHADRRRGGLCGYGRRFESLVDWGRVEGQRTIEVHKHMILEWGKNM